MVEGVNELRYLLVSEELGIFLGIHGNIGIFSNVEKEGATTAYTFPSLIEAKEFVKDVFREDVSQFKYLPITCKKDYAPLHEILKAGYREHTGNMLMNMPINDRLIH